MRAARKSAKLVDGRQHLQVGCNQADLLHPAQQPVSCAAVAMCRSGMHRHCLHISTACLHISTIESLMLTLKQA